MEFSERKRLSDEFDAWRRVRGVHVGILPSTPLNVIAFLQIKGYLRESPTPEETGSPPQQSAAPTNIPQPAISRCECWDNGKMPCLVSDRRFVASMDIKPRADIDGKLWSADFPFCCGCPNLTIGIGCGYQGNGCAYPDRRMENPISHRDAFFAMCDAFGLSIETVSHSLGSCVERRAKPEFIELVKQHLTAV